MIHGRTILGTDTAASVASQLLVSASSFLTGIVVARFGGTEYYALYSICLTLLLTTSTLQGSLALIPYAILSGGYSHEERALAAGNVLISYGVYTAACILIVSVCMAFFAPTISEELGVGWLTAYLVLVPCWLFREVWRGIAIGDRRFWLLLKMDTVGSTFIVVALGVVVIFDLFSVRLFFLALAAAAGGASFCWYRAYRGCIAFAGASIQSALARTWGLGRWVLIANAPLMINASANLWIVAATLGAADAGLYGAAGALVMAVNPIVTAVHNVVLSHAGRALAVGGRPGLCALTLRSMAFIAVAGGALCAMLFTTGDRLLEWVFGLAFSGGGAIVSVLAVGLSLRFLGMPLQVAMLAEGRVKLNALINSATLVCNVAGCFVMLHHIGVIGAAYSVVLSECVTITARLLALSRRKLLVVRLRRMRPAVHGH